MARPARLTDMQILPDRLGQPAVMLSGEAARYAEGSALSALFSIAHTKRNVAASAIGVSERSPGRRNLPRVRPKPVFGKTFPAEFFLGLRGIRVTLYAYISYDHHLPFDRLR